jgi:phage FluMu protein Com
MREKQSTSTVAEEDHGDEGVLDGNAVAGLLAATFGVEMSAVPGRCAHCHTVSVVAEFRAYTRAPGTVLRCPACSDVVLRIVETPTATLVDASGIAWLRFERR